MEDGSCGSMHATVRVVLSVRETRSRLPQKKRADGNVGRRLGPATAKRCVNVIIRKKFLPNVHILDSRGRMCRGFERGTDGCVCVFSELQAVVA